MNNIKKIGLTALAGSLVATSAFAGAMSVSGSAKVTYASNGEEGVAGVLHSLIQKELRFLVQVN
jgi:outer membrane protein OmpU